MTDADTTSSDATWSDLLAALAVPDGVAAAFGVTQAITRARVGCRLYTATTCDVAAGYAARLYSSDPVSYPVSGRKPMVPDAWSAQVLDRKQPFVANTIAEIAALFPDHALIRSLGCESCLNVPVIAAGAVRGTINILDVAGHFTPARVAAAMALMPFYSVALLAALALEPAR